MCVQGMHRDDRTRLLIWDEHLVCALGRPDVEGSMNHQHDMFERPRITTLTIYDSVTEYSTHNGIFYRTRFRTA